VKHCIVVAKLVAYSYRYWAIIVVEEATGYIGFGAALDCR
jgi:hypothetical protein